MPWNEISRRYVDEEPEFYIPDVWRGRSADKKQGSEGEVKLSHETQNAVRKASEWSFAAYNFLLGDGVAPEQARGELKQSMMTEWYWSGTMKAVHKMCSLRCKPDTQYESRIVAEAIDDKMMKLFPVSWEALRAYED
jgi:thymidylate synthase (FAD)